MFWTIIIYLGNQKTYDLLHSIVIMNLSELFKVVDNKFVNLTLNLQDIWKIAIGKSSSAYINTLLDDFREKIEYIDPFTSDSDFYASLKNIADVFYEYEIEYT